MNNIIEFQRNVKGDKIKIGNNILNVYECDYIKSKYDEFSGYTNHNKKMILLNKNLSKNDKIITLNHEILHNLIFQIEAISKGKYKKILRNIRKNEDFIEDLSILISKTYKLKSKFGA